MTWNEFAGRVSRRLKTLCWAADVKLHPGVRRRKDGTRVLFDTSIGSMNMGDSIIAHYCSLALEGIAEEALRLPTHLLPNGDQLTRLASAERKIVCGTNLMTPHFEEFSNWKMPGDLRGYRDILTLGKANKIRHDEEVVHKPHLVYHAYFVFQPFLYLV